MQIQCSDSEKSTEDTFLRKCPHCPNRVNREERDHQRPGRPPAVAVGEKMKEKWLLRWAGASP